jgi:hypothetical protein
MKNTKRKINDPLPGAPALHSPTPPAALAEIRARAYAIYRARGGADGMALGDWLEAEQELNRQLAPAGAKPLGTRPRHESRARD